MDITVLESKNIVDSVDILIDGDNLSIAILNRMTNARKVTMRENKDNVNVKGVWLISGNRYDLAVLGTIRNIDVLARKILIPVMKEIWAGDKNSDVKGDND